eukprot:511010_1
MSTGIMEEVPYGFLRRIDFDIGLYYTIMGETNYFDKIHRGKLYKWVKNNNLSEYRIYKEILSGKPEKLLLFDIDEFPIDDSWNIVNDTNKKYVIFYIIQYCYTHHRAPKIQHINYQLKKQQHKHKTLESITTDKSTYFPNDILNSEQLYRLESFMKIHNMFSLNPKYFPISIDYIDHIDISSVTEDYLYIQQYSENDNQLLKLLYLVFGFCERKRDCPILSRHNRKNQQNYNKTKQYQLYNLKYIIREKENQHSTELTNEEENRILQCLRKFDSIHVAHQHYIHGTQLKKSFRGIESILQSENTRNDNYQVNDTNNDNQTLKSNAILCGGIPIDVNYSHHHRSENVSVTEMTEPTKQHIPTDTILKETKYDSNSNNNDNILKISNNNNNKSKDIPSEPIKKNLIRSFQQHKPNENIIRSFQQKPNEHIIETQNKNDTIENKTDDMIPTDEDNINHSMDSNKSKQSNNNIVFNNEQIKQYTNDFLEAVEAMNSSDDFTEDEHELNPTYDEFQATRALRYNQLYTTRTNGQNVNIDVNDSHTTDIIPNGKLNQVNVFRNDYEYHFGKTFKDSKLISLENKHDQYNFGKIFKYVDKTNCENNN